MQRNCLLEGGDGILFSEPLGAHLGRIFLYEQEIFLHVSEPLFAEIVGFSLESLAGDL